MISADKLWPELDTLGEEEVRKRLAEGRFGQREASACDRVVA